MKISLFTLAMLTGFAFPVQAETINLSGPVNCGGLRHCNNVPNDVGLDVDVASPQVAGPNPGNPPTTIVIDGKAYSGQMAFAGNYTEFNGTVTADDQSQAFLSVRFHSTVRRVDSGRTHQTITTWWLDSGYVSRP